MNASAQRLSQAWESGDLPHLQPAAAQRHIEAMSNSPDKIDPIVHCELLGGLLKGESHMACKPDLEVLALLKELEKSDRQIVIIHTTFTLSATGIMSKQFAGIEWAVKSRLDIGHEWGMRSLGDAPKAEMIITPHTEHRMPLDAGAHITVISPAELILQ